MNRILITGAHGQLAYAIARAFADREVVACPRSLLDITNPEEVQRIIGGAKPDVIVNCAAFNDVDGAESAPWRAFDLNALAVRSLARVAESIDAVLVHYGTDFVFDGTATEPMDEDTTPSPRSAYSASKLVGEWFALDSPRAYVLRVESLFGAPRDWTGRKGTLDTIVEGLRQGNQIRVLTDRVVSPSYTPDIAAATRHLLETHASPGLYHCVNAGFGTWEQVAREAALVLGVTPQLQLLTTDQLVLKAARPRYCALATKRLSSTGFSMPPWQDALRRWLNADRMSALNG